MAKQYLDENGVKQLWGKCKDTFALKSGSEPTKTPFTLISLSDVLVISSANNFVLDMGNALIINVNVDFQNISANVLTPSDYGFAVANVGVALPGNSFGKITDFNGTKLSETSTTPNVPIASSVCFTTATISITYDTTQYGISCAVTRKGKNANEASLYLINFGGLKIQPSAHLYVQAQVIIPLQ